MAMTNPHRTGPVPPAPRDDGPDVGPLMNLPGETRHAGRIAWWNLSGSAAPGRPPAPTGPPAPAGGPGLALTVADRTGR